MKSTKEIISILESELANYIDNIKSTSKTLIYYNEILGDASFLLAGLLESLLKKKFNDWDRNKWIDDSLITSVVMKNNRLIILGVMIWGRDDTTEQWTDPFSFEIEFVKDEMSFGKFAFRFCDLDNPEISYEEFRGDRNYWNAISRNWKYLINSDNSLEENR